MKYKYLLPALLLPVLTGCGTEYATITKITHFEPSKPMRENAVTMPRLDLDIQGEGKAGTCYIKIPVGVLAEQKAIRGHELVISCNYDNETSIGSHYEKEIYNAQLDYADDNKVSLSLHALIKTRNDDYQLEIKSESPLEFKY
ncbi:MAG: hypothetical protein ACTJH9_04040 [Pseudoalteromonas sp.]|uniref:hypothetical protein n=1 Tax=Pseudoalteromonas TaxID=53246 RepID=UPI003F9B49F9